MNRCAPPLKRGACIVILFTETVDKFVNTVLCALDEIGVVDRDGGDLDVSAALPAALDLLNEVLSRLLGCENVFTPSAALARQAVPATIENEFAEQVLLKRH